MPFAAMSLVLSLVASLYALMGHCNTDHKTLAACGLYTLAGELSRHAYVEVVGSEHFK